MITRDDLQDRLQEIQAKLAAFDKRTEAMKRLKAYIEKEGLDHTDLLQIYRMMKPKRGSEPVASKKPLFRPGHATLKHAKRTQDGKRYYINDGGIYRGDLKSIRYVSPDGLYVWGGMGRRPEWFTKHVDNGGKPEALLLAGKTVNGAAHA